MPKNDIPHILNKLILKRILKPFEVMVATIAAKKLIHHNIKLALHSGFNATEKKNAIAR